MFFNDAHIFYLIYFGSSRTEHLILQLFWKVPQIFPSHKCRETANIVVAFYIFPVKPWHPLTGKQKLKRLFKDKTGGDSWDVGASTGSTACTHRDANMSLSHCSLSTLESRCSSENFSCVLNHLQTRVFYPDTQKHIQSAEAVQSDINHRDLAWELKAAQGGCFLSQHQAGTFV